MVDIVNCVFEIGKKRLNWLTFFFNFIDNFRKQSDIFSYVSALDETSLRMNYYFSYNILTRLATTFAAIL